MHSATAERPASMPTTRAPLLASRPPRPGGRSTEAACDESSNRPFIQWVKAVGWPSINVRTSISPTFSALPSSFTCTWLWPVANFWRPRMVGKAKRVAFLGKTAATSTEPGSAAGSLNVTSAVPRMRRSRPSNTRGSGSTRTVATRRVDLYSAASSRGWTTGMRAAGGVPRWSKMQVINLAANPNTARKPIHCWGVVLEVLAMATAGASSSYVLTS